MKKSMMQKMKKYRWLRACVMGAMLLTASPWASAAESPDEEAQVQAADDKKIVINLAARSLALFDNNEKIRLYPIGPGKESTPTPTGYYQIRSKDLNPTWVDPSDPEFSIPSGEANPLGYRWMEIQGNYGIHGTNKPNSIGHYVSNGCIRMLEKDVEALFDLVEVGTPVEITYNRIVVEKTPNDTVVYYIYPDGYDCQTVTVQDVNNWLAGYGVDHFESDEAIAKKIEASDGQPTYVAKAYPLTVNGKKLQGKAVVKDDVTYLPVVDIAKALQISLGWKPADKILVSSLGEAVGYDRKDVLYCNADDVAALFQVDGGLNKQGVYALQDVSKNVVTLVEGKKPLQPVGDDAEDAKQSELAAQAEAAQKVEEARQKQADRKAKAAENAAKKKQADEKSGLKSSRTVVVNA